jgi:pimeloyl-ACP methyl ester carboxylesterase
MCLALTLGLIGSYGSPAPAGAQALPSPGPCHQFSLPSGALGLICVPESGWNGDLVVYGHGYTAFNEPIGFQNLELPDGTPVPFLVQALGFAFATTSYRQNGLTILEGADDVRELVRAFRGAVLTPRHTYMVGVSEGGLITTLLVEQSPDLFSGGLAACGPIGDFRRQINYMGDFRVLFDYYFPGVLPPSPIAIPASLIAAWDDQYVPAVTAALAANPSAALELASVAGAAIEPRAPATVVPTTQKLLWYNVFGTNDAVRKLGGNPYGNSGRWYRGSSNDALLNRGVARFRASPIALRNLQRYQTTGRLSKPLVTLHTTGDEVIPYWHALLYRAKARPTGQGKLTPIRIDRYGHCNFTTAEIVSAFAVLVEQVTGGNVANQSTAIDAARGRR